MVVDELLKCSIASNALLMRKIHRIQMKELMSCKYLPLRSPACISFRTGTSCPNLLQSKENLNLGIRSKNIIVFERVVAGKVLFT